MTVHKALIVDDSAADRTHIEKILNDAGCVVRSAVNGKEALDMVKREKPDVIFLDVLMPEMDGFETCRELKRDPATKDIPVIFVTSKGQKADRLWAQMQGGKGLVSKPCTAEEIQQQLANL